MSSPHPDWYPDLGRSPRGSGSDTWLVIDAFVAILTGVITIAVVVLRHPFMMLGILILVAVAAALAEWW